jgi:hypothetical protein
MKCLTGAPNDAAAFCRLHALVTMTATPGLRWRASSSTWRLDTPGRLIPRRSKSICSLCLSIRSNPTDPSGASRTADGHGTDRLQFLLGIRPLGKLRQCQFRVGKHSAQEVTEVVRNGAGQGPDALQLLFGQMFFLGAFEVGDIDARARFRQLSLSCSFAGGMSIQTGRDACPMVPAPPGSLPSGAPEKTATQPIAHNSAVRTAP